MKKNNSLNIKKMPVAYGISSQINNTNSNEHVVFFDFDNKKYENVEEFIKYVQKNYFLDVFHIISSSNGFNAVCFDILPFPVLKQIFLDVYTISIVDVDFIKAGFKRKYFTLRFDYDKNYFSCIESEKNNNCLKSLAHKLFIEWFFNIKIKQNKNFNNNDNLIIIQFPSLKHGYHYVDKEIPKNFNVNKKWKI